ncbi:hypothetical protein ISF_07217 [Cordyceps fumosorosea ARSEF 2679]|uniref:Uncharacterized protein n=1 Tax=Cordyceps fumosorosea (strain ARSEF 2679) TaxID=1081104 RepID=A0A167Q4Y9_CORFA|nr:hypothetical protein ISF_07217 [Cordyceps fumosorosea ARSEF 2679]OAA57296.1 hypothetical protein ISF_07217 [Cordyceps fumosorosea ARSEF 2679]
MTTPTKEPQEISEEMFDGQTPTNSETVWVKWDVDNGRDRTMDVPIGTSFTLAGSPKIQGIEIKGRKVTLYGWADTWPNGNPSLTVEGPTGGKKKVDPKRRIGSYRVEIRD